MPKTILLVEDEALVASDEANLLKDEGYIVLQAVSGKKAIEAVRAARPDGIDIVLMDIDLGQGMDGAQAAQEILKERDIPIIFLSSHTEKAMVDKTENIAFYGYVVKDSIVTVLSASIKMAFKLHEAHRELMKQEAALHEMSETFRLFMEYNPIYVFIKDDRIRPVYLSRNYEKMLGRPLSELLGKSMDDLFPSELSKSMIADDLRILREGKPVDNIIEGLGGRTYSTLKFPILIDGVPRYLAGYTIDVTDRKRAEDALRVSVRQKDILMKELQHRVKNSLSVVSGLLGLEMENLTESRSREVFANTRSRIRSIASLYELLSGAPDPASMDLGHYFGRLTEALFKTYVPETGNILLKTRLDEVKLDTRRAVPLGLILNELVTNSLKYAYAAGAKGDIRVDLESSGDTVTLAVSDDGTGLPKGFDPKTSGGMGWSLVRMLTEEIDGELSCPAGAPGTRVLIRFKP